jgi:2-methylcitrate dehydratase PrpD
VTIKVGGREEEARVDSPLGYPGRPLTETQIREKFVECTAPLFDPDTATQVFAEIAGPTAYDLANKRLGIDPPSLPS